MKKPVIAASLALTTLFTFGCASKPSEISSSYVSPLKYKAYDCDQIVEEMDYVSHKTVVLYNSLDKKASDDATQMAVGMILFWPALFALEGGDGPEATEYAELKGNFEALRTAAVRKKCDAEMMPESPENVIAKAAEEKATKQNESMDDSTFN